MDTERLTTAVHIRRTGTVSCAIGPNMRRTPAMECELAPDGRLIITAEQLQALVARVASEAEAECKGYGNDLT